MVPPGDPFQFIPGFGGTSTPGATSPSSSSQVGEAVKKITYFVMAVPLRPLLPPPSSIMAAGTFAVEKDKVFFP